MRQVRADVLVQKSDQNLTRPDRQSNVKRFLRDLDSPHRLRNNLLLGNCSPDKARMLVEGALDELPLRSRIIIARCDLANELHATVARDLGISERHFYRERHEALSFLHEALERKRFQKPISFVVNIDSEDIPLVYANALQNAGDVQQAIRFLEKALFKVSAHEARARLALQLGKLCCETSKISRAVQFLDIAYESLRLGSLPAPPSVELEAATLSATLLLHSDRINSAKSQLDRAIREFKRSADVGNIKYGRAMAKAQLTLADIFETEGSFSAALAAAFEANRITRQFELEPTLRSRALIALSAMRVLTGSPVEMAMADLSTAYDLAKMSGLTRDCAEISILFCSFYGNDGKYDLALRFGNAALNLAKATMSEEGFALARCCVASVHIANHNTVAARRILKEDATSPETRSFICILPRLVEAELLLAEERFESALDAASDAVDKMRRIQSKRGLGSALRVRAEIEGALGWRRQALRSIDEAIALLSGNAPPFALAQAYGLSGRLSGNRRHKQMARTLGQLSRIAS